MEQELDDVTSIQKERMGVPHAGPGIILLTASKQLLYTDRRASELCQQIIRSQAGKTAKGVLPPAVASLVDQILKILTVRTDPKDWEQIQFRRIVNTPQSSVLLCGTALIDQTHAQTRILIVISEVGVGAWQDHVIVQAKETFHLTARETTVLQHLLKGWTNKEIANEMRLSEQTVKEHFKHIADKTSTTTRTGIAMKIIHLGLGQARTIPSPDMMVPTMSERLIELVGSA